jgi:hypothetical protein
MQNILFLLIIVSFVLFFPLPPFGLCFFLLNDLFIKRRELRLSKKAPKFPCVKVLEIKDSFAVCESYYPPTGGSNMYRSGYIKCIKVPNTENLAFGEVVYVVPFRFNDSSSSISLKLTREKMDMNEFRRRVASLLV